MGLLRADALAKPGDRAGQRMSEASLFPERPYRPHLHPIVAKREAFRHYADHFARRIVESDGRADRVGRSV
jgi:hypothetical protein